MISCVNGLYIHIYIYIVLYHYHPITMGMKLYFCTFSQGIPMNTYVYFIYFSYKHRRSLDLRNHRIRTGINHKYYLYISVLIVPTDTLLLP